MNKTGMILYRATDEFNTVYSVTGFSFSHALAYLAEQRDLTEIDRRPGYRDKHGVIVRIELWDTQAYQYETEQQSWNQSELDEAIASGEVPDHAEKYR